MKKIHIKFDKLSENELRAEKVGHLDAKSPYDAISFSCSNGGTVQCSGTNIGAFTSGTAQYGVTCDGVNYLCPDADQTYKGFSCADKDYTTLNPKIRACCGKFPKDSCNYTDYNGMLSSGTCQINSAKNGLYCN